LRWLGARELTPEASTRTAPVERKNSPFFKFIYFYLKP
jgi:hypothetical protein